MSNPFHWLCESPNFIASRYFSHKNLAATLSLVFNLYKSVHIIISQHLQYVGTNPYAYSPRCLVTQNLKVFSAAPLKQPDTCKWQQWYRKTITLVTMAKTKVHTVLCRRRQWQNTPVFLWRKLHGLKIEIMDKIYKCGC